MAPTISTTMPIVQTMAIFAMNPMMSRIMPRMIKEAPSDWPLVWTAERMVREGCVRNAQFASPATTRTYVLKPPALYEGTLASPLSFWCGSCAAERSSLSMMPSDPITNVRTVGSWRLARVFMTAIVRPIVSRSRW